MPHLAPSSHTTHTTHNRIRLLVTFLAILSILDGALTLWGLRLGTIEEANPLMQWLIARNPVAFMAAKVSLPVILGFLLWKAQNRPHKFVIRLLIVAILTYALVIIAHAYWIVLSAVRGSL
ncbi:hypothetical protein CEB3_c19340 [Peptococcaceae bacterium CEB3]|nr:hypothetical protein CEB3_c19340 [Peptococcaceae bacterium CEB3]